MTKYTHFKFCPNCGSRKIEALKNNGVNCGDCGYSYFHNCASAVAGIIETPQGIIMTTRRSAPKRGYHDLPGGFVNYGESFEGALMREVKEELNIEIAVCRYFGSFSNIYRYKKVTYFTTDAFFICRPLHLEDMHPGEEISEIAMIKPEKINLERIAFRSTREAIRRYREESDKR